MTASRSDVEGRPCGDCAERQGPAPHGNEDGGVPSSYHLYSVVVVAAVIVLAVVPASLTLGAVTPSVCQRTSETHEWCDGGG